MSATDMTIEGRGGSEVIIHEPEMEQMLRAAMDAWGIHRGRVLILGPDFTRFHSAAGKLTSMLYKMIEDRCHVDVLPCLGTHVPMSDEELDLMYPGIPRERIITHNWRTETVTLGSVPSDYIEDLSEGKLNFEMNVEVNRRLVEGDYDPIISIGQVVPHEVIGMANHLKNVFVGAGGRDMLNKTHYLGAVYGMERMMGRIQTPVRRVMDYARAAFFKEAPLRWIQTVIGRDEREGLVMRGMFLGHGRKPFIDAAKLSQQVNLDLLDRPLQKCVVYLDPAEFKSTWLGNKAIYRSRMAMADQGELLVLAPGVKTFGEDEQIDVRIRKYGYRGTPQTLQMVEAHPELKDNLAAAAHLIHGSSEGRFRITYAPGGLSREEVEGVGFDYADPEAMLKRYDPQRLVDGWNHVDGEEIFYISNPGLGLWANAADFEPDEGEAD